MIWDYQHQLAHRLLLWGGASVAAGLWIVSVGGGFWPAFGFQAILWGIIEGIFALFGIYRAQKHLKLRVDPVVADSEATKLRRSLLINSALDLIYIAAAVALLLLRRPYESLVAGSAWAIILQGAFLLIFDLLHTWRVPTEYVIPDLGILGEREHRADTLEGGRPAILMVHGFPGTPQEMRSLGDALNRQGWTVRLMCLPGHGSAYRSLLQTRAQEWERSVQEELAVLQVLHSPVLLVGYSLGAGLSMPAAAKLKPDGLILLAPFWIDEPWWVKVLIWVVRPFLPVAVNPFKYMRVDTPRLKVAIEDIVPDFDLSVPVVQAALQQFQLPLIFAEQFRLMSRWVRTSAREIRGIPVLLVQAAEDQIVRKQSTQKIIRWVPANITYREVPGDHNLNLQSHPGYSQVEQTVLDFTSQFLDKSPKE